jgi:hypothetical protein
VTLDALNMFYPNRDKSRSEAVNIGDVGHNINLHFKRTEAFERILAFIKNARIGPWFMDPSTRTLLKSRWEHLGAWKAQDR